MTIVTKNSLTLSNINDGTNGKTQYTHIAYSNIKFLCNESQNFTLSEPSFVRFGVDTRWVYKELQAGTYTASWPFFGSDPASGVWKHAELVSNFSNSNSINTTHIGVYVDFVESNSVDPSKYNWSIFKGNDGVGVKSTDITYTISTSGTTAPSTGWTSSVPTLVKGQYLWTKTVWSYTDTSSKTGYSVTYISKDGVNGTDGTSGVIVSSVAPTSPQTGQLWQDTSTIPQLVKKWTGTSWVIWAFYAQNLIADNISTISLNLGDMTGGTVKLMDDVAVGDTLKKYGIYQSKLGLLSSGPALSTPSTFSDSQMGVANLNEGELRFIVTDYTENLKNVQETGMSDTNNAFIKFDSYDNGKDVMLIGSSGDIVFKGNTSQDTPWITLSSGVKYKFMFSRVYISFAITGTSAQYMHFGFLPENLRPTTEQFLVLAAWSTGVTNNRHINIRPSDGAVILWNPVNGMKYYSEVSYTL